jgi:uncharacterized 2Fe-2S/4Fe-4S cluster protein (DUF4445 family)
VNQPNVGRSNLKVLVDLAGLELTERDLEELGNALAALSKGLAVLTSAVEADDVPVTVFAPTEPGR